MREFALNELALNTVFSSRGEAESACTSIAKGMGRLMAAGLAAGIVRSKCGFSMVEICSGVSLRQLLMDLIKNPKFKEEALFLLKLSDKCPINIDIPHKIASELQALDAEDLSFPISYLLNCVLVSFPASDRWVGHPLIFKMSRLCEDDIKVEAVSIDNVSSYEDSALILADHRVRVRSRLTPTNFWELKGSAFEFLDFGVDVESQVGELGAGFSSIVNKLGSLDEACRTWIAGVPLPNYSCRVSNESVSTMQEHSESRRFRGVRGQFLTFQRHARVGSSYRIHLIEHVHEMKIEIGYIGKHLPTSTNST